MFKQYQLKNYRFRLVAYVIVLTIIGILVIGSAKQSVQSKQILGLAIGLVFMVIVSLIDYSYILRFWSVWYLMAIFMQVAVLLFGNDVNGSKRWIDLGFFQFQPSELSKILLICFWAAIFVRYHEKLNTLKMLVIFIVASGIPMGLILVEDMSTTIVIALIFITLLFIAGLSYKIILKVLAAAVPAGVVFLILLLNHAIPMQEYRYNRILAWLNPEKYSNGAYQQQNSIMAIGSGQLWGKGLNNTSIVSMKNGNFIAEPQTDFIFAVVGEELGFVGSVIIVILLLLIVIECILIAKNARDLSGRLICCGVAALIGFQSFVNICVATGLMPNTGLPLPFVSYGLTSLVSLFIGIGLVLNVGLQPRKYGQGEYLQ